MISKIENTGVFAAEVNILFFLSADIRSQLPRDIVDDFLFSARLYPVVTDVLVKGEKLAEIKMNGDAIIITDVFGMLCRCYHPQDAADVIVNMALKREKKARRSNARKDSTLPTAEIKSARRRKR